MHRISNHMWWLYLMNIFLPNLIHQMKLFMIFQKTWNVFFKVLTFFLNRKCTIFYGLFSISDPFPLNKAGFWYLDRKCSSLQSDWFFQSRKYRVCTFKSLSLTVDLDTLCLSKGGNFATSFQKVWIIPDLIRNASKSWISQFDLNWETALKFNKFPPILQGVPAIWQQKNAWEHSQWHSMVNISDLLAKSIKINKTCKGYKKLIHFFLFQNNLTCFGYLTIFFVASLLNNTWNSSVSPLVIF